MYRRLSVIVGLVVALAITGLAVVAAPNLLGSVLGHEPRSPVTARTARPPAQPPAVRIAAAGDTGTGDAAEQTTASEMVAEGRGDPYDALLLLGDLVYEDGDAALVDRVVTKPFASILDNGATLLPVLGNHDYVSGEQRQILAELGRRRPWYSQRVGSVRVLVLDSNQVANPRQTQWLRDTLAEPQPAKTWTVVAMHHPAYSAGYHGSDLQVRHAWGPLFAAFDVSLVLAGHDHDYQRCVPQDGVTYLVSGAGAKLRPTGQDSFTAVSASTLHYLDLLFYDNRLVGRAIDQSGGLVDSFTITR